jgi:hypothetical protein
MVFRALDGAGGVLAERTYYSVGGGFVVDEAATGADRVVLDTTPLPFRSPPAPSCWTTAAGRACRSAT